MIFHGISLYQRWGFMTDTRNYPNAFPGVSQNHHDYCSVEFIEFILSWAIASLALCCGRMARNVHGYDATKDIHFVSGHMDSCRWANFEFLSISAITK